MLHPLLETLTHDDRSFAILRHKPLTLLKTPALPSTSHDYENPDIHSGFMILAHSYHILDTSFVDSWNEASEAPATTVTHTALQKQLNLPQASNISLTDMQKAEILITQQWLRLIVWQASMRQGLLSSTATEESMTFKYPLKIAHSLLGVVSGLPIKSIEVHGMSLFEKIFEIGNTMLDVLQASGTNIPQEIYSVTQDPFGMFIQTLSQTPTSQKQFVTMLLARVAEKPEIYRFGSGLMPSLMKEPTISTPVEPGNAIVMPFSAQGLMQRPPLERNNSGQVNLEGGMNDHPLAHLQSPAILGSPAVSQKPGQGYVIHLQTQQ